MAFHKMAKTFENTIVHVVNIRKYSTKTPAKGVLLPAK